MQYDKILNVKEARWVLSATTGAVYSQSQLRRWARAGINGGFKSNRDGRILFRSGELISSGRTIFVREA